MENKENELAEIKKKLKTWEYYFIKCHQRKPSKVDIDSSPADIKDSYLLYSKLKEKEGSGASGVKVKTSETKVWGAHVSVKALEKTQTKFEFSSTGELETVEVVDVEKESVAKGCTWSERFTQRSHAHDSWKLPNSVSIKPMPSVLSSDSVLPEMSADHIDTNASTGMLHRNSLASKRTRPRRIPKGWQEHVNGVEQRVDKDQGKAADSQVKKMEESCPERVSSAVSSKEQTECGPCSTATVSARTVPDIRGQKVGNGTAVDTDRVGLQSLQAESVINNSHSSKTNRSTSIVTSQPPGTHMTLPSTAITTFKLTETASNSSTKQKCSDQPIVTSAAHSSISTQPPVKSSHYLSERNEISKPDPYSFEEGPESPVRQRKQTGVRAKSRTAEKKAVTRKRKITGSKPQTTEELTAEKPAKKARAATSSRGRKNVYDNFVKLNLRKKVYARGKTGLKGAAYKRQQWKSKMSAKRGTACFKCGEEGHWANKCNVVSKSTKADVFNEDVDGFLAEKPVDDYLDDLMYGSYSVCEQGGNANYESKPSCDPLFDDSIGETECRQKISHALRKVFGFESFRPGQVETVERLLRGRSTLVMLSTGAGKSLCYQLAAYMYAKRSSSIVVVISPLVSLMEDQVVDLPKGVNGVCLHTNQTDATRAKYMAAVKEGHAQFMLCSPEFLCSNSSSNIEFFNKIPQISFACIDEAHCLSQWSHNFRPSYLRVCKILRLKFGVNCFLGLTATATQETVTQIASYLNLQDNNADCIKGTILPPNLNLSVSKDASKEQALVDLLQSKRFRDCQSIIIYCTRREQTDRLASVLRTVLPEDEKATTRVPVADSYHAGLTAAQRARVQKLFMNGKLRIVVATVAFGMGLDKSDVRAVIHYNLPKGFESYVQEIGRAGRDGLPAECHVFLEPEGTDVSELEKHTYADSIDRSSIRKLLSMIYQECKCQMLADTAGEVEQVPAGVSVCPGHEQPVVISTAVSTLNVTDQGISTLLFYLELHDPTWLENMSSVYSSCTIKCYGGLTELHTAAKKCIPLGVAMALKQKQSGKKVGKEFTFNILEVSNLLNKPSGYVKKDLRQLQWTQTAEGKYKRTGLVVEFGDLALRVKAPGNLCEDELDNILMFLNSRTAGQEKKELMRLNYFYHVLSKLAYKDYFMVSEEADVHRSDSLKGSIVHYFQNEDPLEDYTLPNKSTDESAHSYITSQVRSFISTYSHEHEFSGRDVAKILYGIASPNYPPSVWGRVRRFWRSLLGHDFNLIVRTATEHLINSRH